MRRLAITILYYCALMEQYKLEFHSAFQTLIIHLLITIDRCNL